MTRAKKRAKRRVLSVPYRRFVFPGLLAVGGVVLVVALVRSLSFGGLFDFDLFGDQTKIDHGAVVLEAIKKEAKLETVAMTEKTENVVDHRWGLGKACIERVRYHGVFVVTAGVDLQQVTPSDVVVTENADRSQAVTVTLPPATILHAEVDTANSSAVIEREMVFPWACGGSEMEQTTLQAQNAGRDDAIEAAKKKGILETAEGHAGTVIQDLLRNVYYPNVAIRYRR